MLWNLREFRKRHVKLADWLSWAVLVAPGIILNKDGSLQKTFMYRGMDMDASTPEELMVAVAQMNNTLKRLGTNWCIYAEAQRYPSTVYPNRFYPDVVTTMIDAERRSYFAGQGQHYESAYYLTLLYLPPPDRYDKIEKFLVESEENVVEKERERLEAHLQTFSVETDRIHQLLREIMVMCRPLTDDETLTYLHSTVSPRRHYIRTPHTGTFLDCLLADTPLTAGFDLKFGEKNGHHTHLAVLTVLGLPSFTAPGLLDGLNRLGFSYRWVTRYIPLSKEDANKEFENIRRVWFAKRKSLFTMLKESLTRSESAMVDTDALQKFEDTQEAMREAGQDLASYGYFTATVVLSDENKKRLEDKTREVEKVINHEGFATICEGYNCLDAWLGSIPGLARANIRRPIVNSINLAHMMPMNAVWAGPEKTDHLRAPVLAQTDCNGSTAFRLSLYHGDVGHTMVLGPTGAGKSVLLSFIAAQFRGYEDAQVYFFDVGGSSRVLTAAIGGEFYDLGAEDSDLCFQPYAEIDQETERTWAQEWTEGLLLQEGMERITPEIRREIWETLCRLANAPKDQRTITGFYLMTQERTLRDIMLTYMRPSHVTRGGAHGKLFDSPVDSLSYGVWQVFEMQTLMTQRTAVMPALNYMFHRLEKNCTGKPTCIILDECWLFLDNPLFAEKLRAWLKTMRKNNVAIIFATQNLQDVADSVIAPALLESCPTRIYLPNPNALNPNNAAIYQKFSLNETERGLLSIATPKRHYYFKSPAGSRLFDLGLDKMPFSLAYLTSSNKADQKKCQEILAKYPTDFNRYWLNYKNLPEALKVMENLLKE